MRGLFACIFMTSLIRAIAVIALSLFGAHGIATASAARIDAETVEGIIAIDRRAGTAQPEKLAAVRSAFHQLQSRYDDLIKNLPSASQSELESLWKLSSFMAFSTNEFAFAGNMMLIDDEYERRKVLPPIALRERLLESLVGFRDFERARSYAAKARIPLERIPQIEDSLNISKDGLSILRVDTEKEVLLRENVDLDNQVHIFVVSFIGCTFSRHAADAIERHELLRNWMKKRSTWIITPGLLYFDDVLAWNRRHPSTAFSYVDKMESWRFLDDLSTPTFYFVKQGKVILKLKGWADDLAGISALLDAIKASGYGDETEHSQ